MDRTIEDLSPPIRVALREARPGVTDLSSWIHSPWPALGNRSVVEALEQDGYAVESSIIDACNTLKRLRQQAGSHAAHPER